MKTTVIIISWKKTLTISNMSSPYQIKRIVCLFTKRLYIIFYVAGMVKSLPLLTTYNTKYDFQHSYNIVIIFPSVETVSFLLTIRHMYIVDCIITFNGKKSKLCID